MEYARACVEAVVTGETDSLGSESPSSSEDEFEGLRNQTIDGNHAPEESKSSFEALGRAYSNGLTCESMEIT